MVNMTCGDKPSILQAAVTAAREARSAIDDAIPEIIFCYSCMGAQNCPGATDERGNRTHPR